MQSMTIRTYGDLVRNVHDQHGVVTAIDRRHNTATVRFTTHTASGISWFDLKMPNDDTARQCVGVSLDRYVRPHDVLAPRPRELL